MAKITAAVAASAIAVHTAGSTAAQATAQAPALNAAIAAAVKAVAVAQLAVSGPARPGSSVVNMQLNLTGAARQAEIDRFEASLIAIKPPVTVPDCTALNSAVAAYAAALDA